MVATIRTGAATFSQALLTHGKRIGKRCVNGLLTNVETNQVIPTPNEEDVFEELGLNWLEPYERSTTNLSEAYDAINKLKKGNSNGNA